MLARTTANVSFVIFQFYTKWYLLLKILSISLLILMTGVMIQLSTAVMNHFCLLIREVFYMS